MRRPKRLKGCEDWWFVRCFKAENDPRDQRVLPEGSEVEPDGSSLVPSSDALVPSSSQQR